MHAEEGRGCRRMHEEGAGGGCRRRRRRMADEEENGGRGGEWRTRRDEPADSLRLRIPLARANIHQPPSGETKVTIVESVRDYDVYINTVSRVSKRRRMVFAGDNDVEENGFGEGDVVVVIYRRASGGDVSTLRTSD
jgi:hypothetical protein